MKQNRHEEELMKTMMKGFPRFPLYDVFEDFVEWVALTIRSPLEWKNKDEIDKRAKRLYDKYDEKERCTMQRMMNLLVEAMQYNADCGEYTDTLSRIFQEAGIHNKQTGQFFTPWTIAYAGAKMQFTPEKARRLIEEKGHVTVYEPTVGGGVMILALAQVMSEEGFNPHKELLVYATDIDYRCACMTYIHASLYGIPAAIQHGDELMLKLYQRWFTPVYVFDLWITKDEILKGQHNDSKTEGNDAGRTGNGEPAYAGTKKRTGQDTRGNGATFEQLALPGLP